MHNNNSAYIQHLFEKTNDMDEILLSQSLLFSIVSENGIFYNLIVSETRTHRDLKDTYTLLKSATKKKCAFSSVATILFRLRNKIAHGNLIALEDLNTLLSSINAYCEYVVPSQRLHKCKSLVETFIETFKGISEQKVSFQVNTSILPWSQRIML